MQDILVLYYSHRGSVRALAERIAAGIESVPGTPSPRVQGQWISNLAKKSS